MDIEIRLFHGLNKYLPPGEGNYSRQLKVPSGASVEEVLADLGLPKDVAMIHLVGGRTVSGRYILQPGDVLSAMLPAGGG